MASTAQVTNCFADGDHVHVVGEAGIHPNNAWFIQGNGLYVMAGGPNGYSLDGYELVACPFA